MNRLLERRTPAVRRRVLISAAIGLIAGSLAFPTGPAAAEPTCTPAACPTTDLDFAEQLHAFGIYGQRDYNAWIAKIACKRLRTGVDADAFESHSFVVEHLDRSSTDVQARQFLGTALTVYCPDQTSVLSTVSTTRR